MSGAKMAAMVAGSISWLAAAKVALFVAILSGLGRTSLDLADKKQ